jgi:DNA-binding response OmpR family regulator
MILIELLIMLYFKYMRLIIIEDDKELLSSLKSSLDSCGFITDGTDSGKIGLDLINQNNYDLVILDLSLPDINGEEICKIIRSNGKMLPIIILSADSKIDKKISLLNLGADDYLIKPFEIQELIARIQALLRRPKNIVNPIITINDLELNRQKQTLKKSGQEIYLTRKEFLLLEYLMSSPKIVISRGELMEHVWDMEANFFSKTIEMHIVNLRKKIDSDRNKPLIKTISGRGYKFG